LIELESSLLKLLLAVLDGLFKSLTTIGITATGVIVE
jgi:hypothetical protein